MKTWNVILVVTVYWKGATPYLCLHASFIYNDYTCLHGTATTWCLLHASMQLFVSLKTVWSTRWLLAEVTASPPWVSSDTRVDVELAVIVEALLVEALRCNLFHLLDQMEVALWTPLAPLEQVGVFGDRWETPWIRKKHREIFHALEVCCWNRNLFHLSSSGGDSQPQDLTTGTFGEDATTVPGGGWIGCIGRDESGQMKLKSMGVLLIVYIWIWKESACQKKWQEFKNDEWYWNDDGYKKRISIDWQIV